MFPRIFRVKKGNRIYEYLKLVENKWQKGKVVQRVIANFGNIVPFKAKLPKLLKALRKYSDEKFIFPEELLLEKGFQYGNVLLGKILFEKINLDKIINKFIKKHKVEFDIAKYIQVMVVNRLCDPSSKYGIITRWLKKVYLPSWEILLNNDEPEKTKVDKFYRAMDYLIIYKEEIEKELYFNLRDLFSLKVDLVFYDITSTYFESSQAEISDYGYSRDGKPNNKQILLGLIMVNGLPIAHHVFEGSTSDKTTLKGIIDDIEKRFQIEKVVFVLDRGMISNENIRYLEDKQYGYIISLKRRGCQEMRNALNKLNGELVKVNDDLFACEIKKEGAKRIILCYNRERAEIEKIKRKQIMDELKIRLEKLKEAVSSGKIKNERRIIKIAEKILMRKHGYRYFDYEIKDNKFNYWEDKAKVEYEEKIDGKYLLETNIKELTLKEIVLAYKELSKVEVAFREIKDFIKLRPIFHSDTERIKAHVFICVLSFLLECIIEREIKKLRIPLTPRRVLEKLSEIEVIIANIHGTKLKYITTDIDPHTRAILKVFQTDIPKMLRNLEKMNHRQD